VRRILEENLDTDMSRLAKHDDFTTNLKFLFTFDSLADVAIVQALEKEFRITIPDEEAIAMHTVNDIVVGVSRRLAAANEA
jgi:acyl carrier protein